MQLIRVAPAKNDGRGARLSRLCFAFAAFVGIIGIQAGPAPPDTTCRQFEQILLSQRALGHNVDALVEQAVQRLGRTCGAILLVTLAEAASEHGRLVDVERYAERAVKLFEIDRDPTDPILARPLAFLSAAAFGLNNLPKARRAFDRLRFIRADNAADRALIHVTAAKLAASDGNSREAELELRAAVADQQAAGQSDTAQGAWVFQQLARLYITEGRYEEARAASARALAIIAVAPDAKPLDHIELIHMDAIIDAWQGRWNESVKKFASALAMSDASPMLDPAVTRELVANYSAILRRVGRGREARNVEKRLAALPPDSTRAIVDVTQLAREGKSIR